MSSSVSGPLLVIDVGNSSTTLGCYVGGKMESTDRVPTAALDLAYLQSVLTTLRKQHAIAGSAFASVAPSVNDVVENALRTVTHQVPLRVEHTLKLGARITYPDPETIGADRLANVAGAVHRYNAPVIVVDVGTATTFDIIRARQGYTGGIIAPGPALMLEYLAEKTALLPRIDLTPVRRAIGKTTEEAMRLGALHGYRGMIREITQHLIRHTKSRKITLCATGGYAHWVLKGLNLPFVYDKDLTLYGIARIYELNRK